LKHKRCGGDVVGKSLVHGTIQLECLKCGRNWGVASDLSDLEEDDPKAKKVRSGSLLLKLWDFPVRARFPKFIINLLFNHKLRRVLGMVDLCSEMKCVTLDIGCSRGYLTRHLANLLDGIIVGVDVVREDLCLAKLLSHYEKPSTKNAIEFVCCDIDFLPFKKSSVDLAICASVLEHSFNLEVTVGGIAYTIKKNGTLVAGYPIETRFFNALLRIFMPVGLAIRDPELWNRLNKEKFEKSPATHKQLYGTIRNVLGAHFIMKRRAKSFFTILPDVLSWYETVQLTKKSELQVEGSTSKSFFKS
jgi:2-polyprenyl-3-methyl-5-hydroxy-6-metoxy-1,4-benzoquinol methylase